MNLPRITIILIFIFIGVAALFGGYSSWNSSNLEKTCASCHEISPSVTEWQHSAHPEVRCTECHGTALSNGIHSLKEQANMVYTHVGKEKKYNEDIRMTEKQVLEAHGNPEKYPELVVRVTGFTAYFSMLTPEFRQLVVDRLLES